MQLAGRVAHLIIGLQIAWSQRNLSVPARDIQHISWPAQPGHATAQSGQQAAAFGDGHVESGGAGGGVELV